MAFLANHRYILIITIIARAFIQGENSIDSTWTIEAIGLGCDTIFTPLVAKSADCTYPIVIVMNITRTCQRRQILRFMAADVASSAS